LLRLLSFQKKERGRIRQLQKKFDAVAEDCKKRTAPPPPPIMPDPQIIINSSDGYIPEQAFLSQKSPAMVLELYKKTSGPGLRFPKKERVGC